MRNIAAKIERACALTCALLFTGAASVAQAQNLVPCVGWTVEIGKAPSTPNGNSTNLHHVLLNAAGEFTDSNLAPGVWRAYTPNVVPYADATVGSDGMLRGKFLCDNPNSPTVMTITASGTQAPPRSAGLSGASAISVPTVALPSSGTSSTTTTTPNVRGCAKIAAHYELTTGNGAAKIVNVSNSCAFTAVNSNNQPTTVAPGSYKVYGWVSPDAPPTAQAVVQQTPFTVTSNGKLKGKFEFDTVSGSWKLTQTP